jgi:type II secretory pathway pseudopilin PulG
MTRLKESYMKKRTLTLLEIMIVIFLITLITGVIGYNMKGSLDKGKIFRTEQARAQLQDMLLLSLSEGKKMDEILNNPLAALEGLGIARDPKALLKDGWNENFFITANRNKTDFIITSRHLDKKDEKRNKEEIE